jgi:hypothetical protein
MRYEVFEIYLLLFSCNLSTTGTFYLITMRRSVFFFITGFLLFASCGDFADLLDREDHFTGMNLLTRDKSAEKDTPLTFKHLLSHQSGVPHHSRMWKDGKLNLEFEPGTDVMYSTQGFGIIEDSSQLVAKSFN